MDVEHVTLNVEHQHLTVRAACLQHGVQRQLALLQESKQRHVRVYAAPVALPHALRTADRGVEGAHAGCQRGGQ